ncbi:MAG TPA: proteasome assembly chaperone family protein [Candidatus Altiarchaeales archaeon]|nr:proteasome assembly chaperone family protein [Candidatus Altiarchaeales archaeon]
MNDVEIIYLERPKFKSPVLIEGLPGIGLVGKIAAEHMIEELKAKKFAELYSYYLPPQVNIQKDNTVKLVNMEFYYWIDSSKHKELIILIGDFQAITPDSQYLITDYILDLAQECNVKRIYTLGGLGTGTITKNPRVFGATTSKELVEEMRKYGVVFRGSGSIFGASGLLLGMGMLRGFEGVCLMGETHGQIIDAKSAEALLRVLTKILDIEIDMTEISKKAKETEKQLNAMSKMIEEQIKTMERQEKYLSETPTYIR